MVTQTAGAFGGFTSRMFPLNDRIEPAIFVGGADAVLD
jgi:hypothetical protein